MPKYLDDAFSALLATLEHKAKTNGDKSIIKGVEKKLTLSGADEALIAEITALHPKKARPVNVSKAKVPKLEKSAAKSTITGAWKSAAKSPNRRAAEAGHAETVVQS